MSRETWAILKGSKFFYVRTYRNALKLLIVSLCINLLLGYGIYYIHLAEPERDYYATSGETPPIKLTPLSAPNNSATPLLSEESSEDDNTRVIPQ